MTWKIVHNLAPVYLEELLNVYIPQRSLRSSGQNLFEVPRTRVQYGDRSFSVAAPVLWNNLPLALKSITSTESFKKQLKAYLFAQAYGNL